jgi:DNA-binding NarL/FixJ family response regulator
MERSPASSLSLTELLAQSPYPVIGVDIETHQILGANQACYAALGRKRDATVGLDVTELVRHSDRSAVNAVIGLLSSGAIDSYRARRHFLKGDGSELSVTIGVRTEYIDGKRVALVTIEPEKPGVLAPLVDASIRMALIVTDHNWIIANVSTDIEWVVGVPPEIYVGQPVISLLHTDDVQRFVLAVARVASSGDSAIVRVRVLRSLERWLEVACVVASMCRHSPPRLGLALAPNAELGEDKYSENHRQVAVRGTACLDGMNRLRFRMPLESLSTRQWEILTRLLRGERAHEIAADLYLSPSTVRNHLTAIYRKFGVHSQSELLAGLLNTDLESG